MILDCTYTRDNVTAAKGAIARKAEGLLERHPIATHVSVYRRGGLSTPIKPTENEIVYIVAKGGKWGGSSATRIGSRIAAVEDLSRQFSAIELAMIDASDEGMIKAYAQHLKALAELIRLA